MLFRSVSPDNSITDLIKQLDELSDTYTNALKNIRAEAIQLAAVLQKVSGATEDGRNTTKKAADDAERLARAQRDLAFAESENAKKLAELKLAQQELEQIGVGEIAQVRRTNGSLYQTAQRRRNDENGEKFPEQLKDDERKEVLPEQPESGSKLVQCRIPPVISDGFGKHRNRAKRGRWTH